MFPSDLQEAISNAIENSSLRSLVNAREDLTRRYKERDSKGFMRSDADRTAYILSRMPATYAAVYACLQNLHPFSEQLSLQSILDAGAGPGTASWATLELFEGISKQTLLEKDRDLIALGKKLASASTKFEKSVWIACDLLAPPVIPVHDLVICSYALGEIASDHQKIFTQWLWEKTSKVLLIVEPGSQEGFGAIKRARESLIQVGAHILAPCPHSHACPMPQGDWCHFSVRLDRSRTHRLLKGGSLSYEDEKFSYILAAKPSLLQENYNRIVGFPEKHSGHIQLKLCSSQGTLEKVIVSRKEGDRFRLAKKAVWGDKFN